MAGPGRGPLVERWVVCVAVTAVLLYTLQPYAVVRLRVEWHGLPWARGAAQSIAEPDSSGGPSVTPGASTAGGGAVVVPHQSISGSGGGDGVVEGVCSAGAACARAGLRLQWPADPSRLLLVADSLELAAAVDPSVGDGAVASGSVCVCAWFPNSTRYVHRRSTGDCLWQPPASDRCHALCSHRAVSCSPAAPDAPTPITIAGLRPARVPLAAVLWRGAEARACASGLRDALARDRATVLAVATVQDATVVATGRPKFGAHVVRGRCTHALARHCAVPIPAAA